MRSPNWRVSKSTSGKKYPENRENLLTDTQRAKGVTPDRSGSIATLMSVDLRDESPPGHHTGYFRRSSRSPVNQAPGNGLLGEQAPVNQSPGLQATNDWSRSPFLDHPGFHSPGNNRSSGSQSDNISDVDEGSVNRAARHRSTSY